MELRYNAPGLGVVVMKKIRNLGLVGLALILHFSLFTLHSNAQGVITTVAGSTWNFFDHFTPGGPAANAPLGGVVGVAIDSAGNVFAVDGDNNLLVKVSAAGVLTVIAGNGIAGFSGDGGPATSASLNFPRGVALDAAGNLYIADEGNSRIRQVSPSGVISPDNSRF